MKNIYKLLAYNDRQVKAVLYAKDNGKITNSEQQEINNTSERTASGDLENLVNFKILSRIGEKKGAYYKLKIGGFDG